MHQAFAGFAAQRIERGTRLEKGKRLGPGVHGCEVNKIPGFIG
jgi:hypothetical protein